jgi:hypothetical protein
VETAERSWLKGLVLLLELLPELELLSASEEPEWE